MSILRLFDSSQYIAAGIGSAVISGGVIEDQGAYRPREMPCAGINCLLNTIHEYQNEGTDLVYCMDRPPIYKRELHKELYPFYGGYKGNRSERKLSIEIQRRMSEDILTQIGVGVFAADGFEADDCIASAVAYYKNSYEKVYVHTRDSDLFYLVEDNVEIMPVGNQGRSVTLQNWESNVHTKRSTPYNIHMLLKLFDGEKGDNIPRIPKQLADKIVAQIPPTLYKYCGNIELVRQWIGQATEYDPIVMGTYDLIVPRVVPSDKIFLGEIMYHKEIFEYYAVALGNKYYKGRSCKEIEVGEETLEYYLDLYEDGGDILCLS